MQYTENYELPIIEGTDVPNYAPYNECANKVDTAMKSISDDTEQAVAQVQTLKTEIEHEMDEFTDNIKEEFAQTKEEINTRVNERLSATPRYQLALGMDFPRGYNIGGETGNNRIPISNYEFAQTWDMTVTNKNSFYNNSSYQSTRVLGKISLDICVENSEENGTIEIALCKQNPLGNTTINDRMIALVGGSNNIHIETVTNINLTSAETFYFEVTSKERKTLIGKQYLTVERIGL